MTSAYIFESTSIAKIPVGLVTSSDPTGTPPSFALTTAASDDPTGFVNGEWDGTWSSTTGRIDALTPVAGVGQALAVTAGQTYHVWAKWVVGVETPVVECTGILKVR